MDIRSSSSQAKSLGTIVAISGAFVLTLYKGPEILRTVSPLASPNRILLSQESNWVLGGLFLATTGIVSSLWNVLQTTTAREYPDQITLVFFYSLFGAIQCAIISPILERNLTTWMLHIRIEVVTVVFAGVFAIAFRMSAITWCLNKKGPVFMAMFMPISMVIAVIMGIMFLGDTLPLGSVIGAVIIAVGFYTVMWGQAKEKKIEIDIVDELESSTPNTPLLSSKNRSTC